MMSFFTSGVAQIIDVLFIFGATLFSLVGKDFPLVLQEKPGAFFTEGKDTRTHTPHTKVLLERTIGQYYWINAHSTIGWQY